VDVIPVYKRIYTYSTPVFVKPDASCDETPCDLLEGDRVRTHNADKNIPPILEALSTQSTSHNQ